MRRYSAAVARSPWQGLAELENAEGRFCPESCPTQAWTMACLLEVVEEIQ